MSGKKPSFVPRFPMMTVRGQPIPIPDKFAITIAKIVVEWSRFEMGLAADTSGMMNYAIVRSLTQEAPRSFSKKLELWKRAVGRLYSTVPEYQAAAADISTRAKEIAKFRNHLVHGTWNLNGPNADGGYVVSNMRALVRVEKLDRMVVTQDLLDQLLQEIHDLSDDIFGFMTTKVIHAHKGLLKAVPVSSLEHPARQSPPTDAKP